MFWFMLPAYSPDLNPDEAIYAWAREQGIANTCLDTKAAVQEQMSRFFAGLQHRAEEVQSRCRTKLQALAESLEVAAIGRPGVDAHGDPICASVESS